MAVNRKILGKLGQVGLGVKLHTKLRQHFCGMTHLDDLRTQEAIGTRMKLHVDFSAPIKHSRTLQVQVKRRIIVALSSHILVILQALRTICEVAIRLKLRM